MTDDGKASPDPGNFTVDSLSTNPAERSKNKRLDLIVSDVYECRGDYRKKSDELLDEEENGMRRRGLEIGLARLATIKWMPSIVSDLLGRLTG